MIVPMRHRKTFTVAGESLTWGKIHNTVRLFSEELKQRIVDEQWEYVPDGNWTIDQKLAFIIAAIPCVERYSEMQIAAVLSYGPMHVNPRDYFGAKPNVYRRLSVSRPDLVRCMAAVMKRYKHVPDMILENEMWLFSIALANAIDDKNRTGVCRFDTEEDIIAVCEGWLKTLEGDGVI